MSASQRGRAWHSEERARLILESIEDYAIFMLDPEGRVASWNLGAERIKGYRAEEIIGRALLPLLPARGRRRRQARARAARGQREGRFEDEGWRVRKDGSRFWANVVITAMRDAPGQPPASPRSRAT